jgi:glycosyltransferase involved in cell wall biosynthesis
MKSIIKLTIAIPTYNRNKILKENLRHLLPQLNDECRLIIIDNCSSEPVEDHLKDILRSYQNLNIEIFRNRINIGGNANIVRCFELCESEWLWTLGDDDRVTSDAIEIIFEHIDKYSDVVFFNFFANAPTDSLRTASKLTSGTVEFLQAVDTIGQIMLISSNIYNAKIIAQQCKMGMFYQYSCAPHLVMLLLSVGKYSKCLISDEKIVNCAASETPRELIRSSSIPLILGLPILLHLPLEVEALTVLREVLLKGIKPRGAVFQTFVNHQDNRSAKYLYNKIKQSYCSLSPKYLNIMEIQLYSLIFVFPKLSKLIISYLYDKYRGKKSMQDVVIDRYNI